MFQITFNSFVQSISVLFTHGDNWVFRQKSQNIGYERSANGSRNTSLSCKTHNKIGVGKVL